VRESGPLETFPQDGGRAIRDNGPLPLITRLRADASELLGQYLSDSGLGTWSYRRGAQSDPFLTPAWVERDGLIVDITADQFPDRSEPVLVTVGRTWHDARFPSGPEQ
jgi:hypothetical protein